MKYFLFLIINLLLSIFIYAASYTPSLIVMDFKALDGISRSEAEQLGEIVLNEFINYQIFDILEQSQFSKLTEELNLQSSGLTSESIKELGKQLDVDFLLTGSVGRLNQDIIIYLRIISTFDGSYFLGDMIKTDTVNALDDVVVLTKLVAFRLRQRLTGDFLARIEALISLGKIEEAEDLISYAKTIGIHTFVVDSLEDDLAETARVFLMKKYMDVIEEDNLIEAEFLLNELLHYQLNTSDAADLLEELKEKKEIKINIDKNELIKKIDRQIKEEKYEAAVNSIKILNLKYSNLDPEVVLDLNNRLGILKGDLLYLNAKGLFSAYNTESLSYLDSLFRINKIRSIIAEAITLDPSVEKYGKLLSRVERENEKIRLSEQKRQAKIMFADSGLRNFIYLQSGVGLTFINDPFFEYGAVNGTFPEIYAGGSLNLTFTESIKGVVIGDIGFAYGSSSITNSSVMHDSEFGQLSVYFEPGLSFITSVFDVQAGAGFRLAMRWYESTQTVSGTDSSKDGILFPLGPGAFISGRYNFSQKAAAFIKLRSYTTWYSGFDWLPETSVSLGVCYGVR